MKCNYPHPDPKNFPKGKKAVSHTCVECGKKSYLWEEKVSWKEKIKSIKIPYIKIEWKRLIEEKYE